jgi:hypothetical protein
MEMNCLKIYYFTVFHVKCFGAWIITAPPVCIKTDFMFTGYFHASVVQSFFILPTRFYTAGKQAFKCPNKYSKISQT